MTPIIQLPDCPLPLSDCLPQKLESVRLLLRLIQPEDADQHYQAVIRSLSILRPWLPWATEEQSPFLSNLFGRESIANFLLNKELSVLFILKDSCTVVGMAQVFNINWLLRHFEVGYWGAIDHAGKGYMTEGMRTLLNHLRIINKAERIFITTDEKNKQSRRLAERLEFDLEAIHRKNRKDHYEVWRNTCIYSWIKT